MKRTILGFILSASLLLGSMPGVGLTAYAQEASASGDIHQDTPGNADTADGWRYEDVGDGTLRITDYEGEESELVVPAQIGEQNVTQIGGEGYDLLGHIAPCDSSVAERIKSVAHKHNGHDKHYEKRNSENEPQLLNKLFVPVVHFDTSNSVIFRPQAYRLEL